MQDDHERIFAGRTDAAAPAREALADARPIAAFDQHSWLLAFALTTVSNLACKQEESAAPVDR